MSTVQKNMNGVRRRLMWPVRATLDDGVLSEYLVATLDEMVTQLNQTKHPHFIQSTPIHLLAGTGVYNLDFIAPGFGKARFLYTEDLEDPNHRRVPIEITELETLTEMYGGGDPMYGPPTYYGHPTYPSAAAFYYQLSGPGMGGNFVEFGPVPNASCFVRMVWEPETVRPTNKFSTALHLDQFDSLLEARTALRAMPHCQWKALTSAEAAARRQELQAILMYDIGSIAERRGLEYLFWQWRQTNVNRLRPTGIGWAENRR